MPPPRSAGILLYRLRAEEGSASDFGNGAGVPGAPVGSGPGENGLADPAAGAAPALEVWIAHMGGPFWARKDEGAWSIPKGEFLAGEREFDVALREFEEEIGSPAPQADYTRLGDFTQPSRKVITVFAAEADFAVAAVVSNTFELEWPRGSGTMREFPEVDDARWFAVEVARTKLVKGQIPILDALESSLRG